MTNPSSKYDENILLFIARGKWQDIVQKMKPSIDPAILKRINKNNGSASVNGARFDNGFALLSWDLKKPKAEVVNLIGELLHAPEHLTAEQLTGVVPFAVKQVIKTDENKVVQAPKAERSIRSNWIRCSEENARPAHKFLLQNGLTRILDLERSDIWFVPGRKNLFSFRRATHSIVCGSRNSNGELAAHYRIPISSEGILSGEIKRFSSDKRSTLANTTPVRLGFPDNGILFLAKDVLSAMAIFEATGIPTWVSISGDWKGVTLPKHVSTVVLWANKRSKDTPTPDDEHFIDVLQGQGRACGLLTPTRDLKVGEPELSWFDMWQTEGASAFPTTARALSVTHSIKAS
ncbi:hypothetical protein [Pseudovibrio sp. Ad37]|uniref:hypothetical protein n=1 Tax=Pseudovibrio sp. Ad37 TaxID=989422 RepID=UPI0007AE64E1|nr:hypothetical protein [Pseudovibrio sp. Ad37]KZL24266.1 hypothetical protein PsAD37_02837 [Pseudovibrio sp. Ad37]